MGEDASFKPKFDADSTTDWFAPYIEARIRDSLDNSEPDSVPSPLFSCVNSVICVGKIRGRSGPDSPTTDFRFFNNHVNTNIRAAKVAPEDSTVSIESELPCKDVVS
ncbi:hypothetical protein NC651_022866 [Populus alba x Populus x berolinensis]|nr:hypothetical protein NC651_022866 [Populus alba x Populus x berolinensis]